MRSRPFFVRPDNFRHEDLRTLYRRCRASGPRSDSTRQRLRIAVRAGRGSGPWPAAKNRSVLSELAWTWSIRSSQASRTARASQAPKSKPSPTCSSAGPRATPASSWRVQHASSSTKTVARKPWRTTITVLPGKWRSAAKAASATDASSWWAAWIEPIGKMIRAAQCRAPGAGAGGPGRGCRSPRRDTDLPDLSVLLAENEKAEKAETQRLQALRDAQLKP